MYYAPRYSPEKPGVPVLGYFSVVGGLLLGLLFAADAYMPRIEHLSFASNLDGLPAAYKGEPAHVPAAAPHIAPPPAIAETTGSSAGFALAGEEPNRRRAGVAGGPEARKAQGRRPQAARRAAAGRQLRTVRAARLRAAGLRASARFWLQIARAVRLSRTFLAGFLGVGLVPGRAAYPSQLALR
jgi:hypothetical protein